MKFGCLKGESMKKASSSFLVLFFAALLVTLQAYAREEVLRERVQQTMRDHERINLSSLLRISPHEQIEVLALDVSAQNFQGQGRVNMLSQGRMVGSIQFMRKLKEGRIELPPSTMLEGLELSSKDEVFLESVSATIRRVRAPHPAPSYPFPYPEPSPRVESPIPHSMLTLRINQEVRLRETFPLKQLVKQQLGISLEGVEIERVIVEGQPSRYGRGASVQVELNNRLVGIEKHLAGRVTPLLIQTSEEVKTLRLQVRGDAHIANIHIRIGEVRRRPELPRNERVFIHQEISAGRNLDLARLLPYESRLVKSIILEARATRSYQAEVALLSSRGEFLASTLITQAPMKPVLQLHRPMPIRELQLESFSPVMIESIEIEFENYSRY
jgi:hypothetical protein